MKYKKLFIPGPTEVSKEVREAMGVFMIGHRAPEFSELYKEVHPKLQKLFYTNNPIFLSTSSGSGLMEAAVRNLTNKRVLSCIIGAFGKRWYQMALANGLEADPLEVEWGQAIKPEMVEEKLKTGKYDVITVTHNETSTGVMNPVGEIAEVVKKYDDVMFCVDAVSSLGGVKIPADEWGIDVLLTSTQKAIALPPGLALASVSERALKRAETVKNRGFYFDFLNFKKYFDKFQTPTTPTIPHIYALNVQLDRMLEEGLENRFKRHEEMAKRVRSWAKEKGFELFAEEGYESNTVTTIKNTRGINVSDLNKALAERGKTISNGYGNLKEKTFRIAHMGDLTMDDINELLADIEEILGI